jgi:L-seryl-tRNA(Ser) seleniumtransferase
MNSNPTYRDLPSVHELVEALGASDLPRPVIVNAARDVLARLRDEFSLGQSPAVSLEAIASRLADHLLQHERPNLRVVINATGVILHTGLGRAPLADAAVAAVRDAAAHYANVELDLATGERGKRASIVRSLLCELTGAQSATVVNNNAGATLLMLTALASGREVIVSRGELIEIGGSFRLPDVMAASGATLREVGTTNKTRIADYENAINEHTAALLKVHTSNYRVVGFSAAATTGELVALGRKHNLPMIDDIGSGALIDFAAYGLPSEPHARGAMATGADVVLFSGDKLLGGPQAGIIAGKKQWIDRIETHPMMRALRVDKLTLAGLEATLRLHRDPQTAAREIPVLAMATASLESLRARADHIAKQFGDTVVAQPSTAYLGGGSLPTQGIESVALRWTPANQSEQQLAQRLRDRDVPIVGRVHDGALWFDLRTVLPRQDAVLAEAIRETMP